MCFLTHVYIINALVAYILCTIIVMWHVGLRIGNALPCARGWNLLSVGPLFTNAVLIINDFFSC